MPRWSGLALPTLLAVAGCAGKKTAQETVTPVPVLDDRALSNCTYERLGTVMEERTGVIISPQTEVPRTLGRKARGLGADAIIELDVATIVPVNAAGAGRGRASGLRASAVAIRFTSPACAQNLKPKRRP
jgi:hypothetical protein